MGTKDGLMGRLLGSSDKFTDKQIAETLDMLIDHGMTHGASDIHIEPLERFVLVRYRIDGSLRGVHKLPRTALGPLLAAAKKRAGLSETETRTPQEGEFSEKGAAVRVATMPVFGGERAVMHLSGNPGKPKELEHLGFWGRGLAVLQTILASSHGFVAVAGPRHSGVSSTLFSMLHQLNSPLLSIATVEIHTKHRIPGVSQTYLAAGAPVSETLRAALKQDPNVVMVADVPDGTTAELAIQASGHGHLVLVGMHADGAVAATLRLRAAGAEAFLLATNLKASVGQRLVRALCTDCRERYRLTTDEYKQLAERFGITNPTARKRLHELEASLAPSIFGNVKQLNSTPAGITHLWRAGPGGCEQCGHTGYRGRVALTEVLENSPKIQQALLSKDVLSIAGLHALALKDGFIPLALDGLVKALCGQTTVHEVLQAVNAAPLD
ncbi:MAG TPA: ATPase, T2SS/T4P/T4SS family [Patescibacteria group bacterium]|nr:ATPase, T2SS/T4P/T4SS family [Patescibacteria group bacterium]